MIKSIFLKHKSKKGQTNEDHGTYTNAHSIGILYNANEFTEVFINELTDQFKGEGKDVSKLGFVDKRTDLKLFFSKKDISGTGKIKKDIVSFFINNKFDFLISLDTIGDINYCYVLAQSKAICKIGLEAKAHSQLLQLSLKPENDLERSAMNVIKYLKMI